MSADLYLNPITRRNLIRTMGGTAGILAFGPILAACGDSGSSDANEIRNLQVQLAWLPNGQSAGEFVALDKGYYSDAGVEVDLMPGGPEVNVLSLIGSGAIPVGVSYQANTILARAQGVPVKAFAATLQRAPLTYFSFRRNGVTTIADFAGKTIGIQPDGDPFLRAFLESSGLSIDDVTLERAGASVASLIEGKVDIIAAWPINIGAVAPLLDDPDTVMFPLYDNGLRQQSNLYIATDDTISREKNLLAAILEASAKGWEYATNNTAEAIDIVKRVSGAELDTENEVRALEATVDYMFTDFTATNGWGALDAEVWAEAIETFNRFEMLENAVTVDDVITLEVLDLATDRPKRG